MRNNFPASGALRMLGVTFSALSLALVLTVTEAHHSYAMYDGSIYRVFTGVTVRVVPNAAHFEIHFVPLNEERNALLRDEDGDPLTWIVQMESASVAARNGITRDSFPQGTVFSIGIHPRRDGRPAGDRGDSGLFAARKRKCRSRVSTATRFKGLRCSGPARFFPKRVQTNRFLTALPGAAGEKIETQTILCIPSVYRLLRPLLRAHPSANP